MAKVGRSPESESDLADIWSYVAEDSPGAADRLVATILSTCELLARFPGLGRSRDDLSPALRSFPAGHYLIFYRAVRGGIEIARILSGYRDLDGLLQ